MPPSRINAAGSGGVDLVPSFAWNGQRARPVGKNVFLRALGETFHEFLVAFVQQTFGKSWWHHQSGMSVPSRHVVRDWLDGFAEVSRRPPSVVRTTGGDTRWGTPASGPALALIALGYDLYWLASKDCLPNSIVDRLRRDKSFQSARYEVAVAATMLRADFDVRFLEETPRNKQCDLVATCRRTGARMGVEAKSRVRAGVLGEPGELAYDGDVAGLVNLVRKASKQLLPGLPLVIFVDVNVPPTPGAKPEEKPWVVDFMRVADDLERRADQADDGDRYALLIATNFGFHFGEESGVHAPVELSVVTGRRPRLGIADPATAGRLAASLRAYGDVPEEV